MKFEGLTLLLRHFPTQDEVEDKVSHHCKTPSILETSKIEADKMADQLLTFSTRIGIQKIFTSDSSQAVETAKLLSSKTNLQVQETELLRNIYRPHWENLTNEEVRIKYPAEFEIWCEKPSEIKFKDGECLNDVKKRVDNFCSLYSEPKIIITHTSTFHMFLLRNFELDLNRSWDFKPEFYTFSVIYEGTLWALNTRNLDYLTLDYK
jgi:broad specificity phosphatase PhoE